ncbi:MAG: hypothetical protein QF521_20155 [Alphaproteobacteria bacterium]|nr:hypothetical protein [Alphaproteobacteria bacterium]
MTEGTPVGDPPAAGNSVAQTTAPSGNVAAVGDDPAAGGPAGGAGGEEGTGGMVIVEVEVVDSKLVIDFDKLEDRSIYLTAIIIEPLDEKSNLALGDEVKNHYQNDRASLVAADAKIDEQIGTVLSQIATAAGPQEVAEALGIKRAAIEPTVTASPN